MFSTDDVLRTIDFAEILSTHRHTLHNAEDLSIVSFFRFFFFLWTKKILKREKRTRVSLRTEFER